MLPFFSRRPATPTALLADQLGMSDAEWAEWRTRAAEITELWEWFDGTALEAEDEDQPSEGGEAQLLYPLQLNPIAQAARLHAFALAGEVQDTSDPLVRTMLEPRLAPDEEAPSAEAKSAATLAERVLTQVEYENHSRSADTDAFLAVQSLGAIVRKVGWEPDNPQLPTGIRLEYIDPRYFHCRWSRSYWELDEAWVIYTISAEEAEDYGVTPQNQTATYAEYWSRDHFWIKVDGQFAKDPDGTVYNRPHEWGFVPFIYIPHERAGDFWGRSIVPESIGLIKELNSRLADVGDAMHLGVTSTMWARNLKGGHPVEKTLPGGQPYLDLGKSLGSGDPPPELGRVEEPQLPQAADNFNSGLLELIRISLQTPEIAYGKEEGTQRSGQTLYNRMWPLLAHVRTERTHWTEARNLQAEMVLQILARYNRAGITKQHLGLRKRQLWSPMVPIDRAQLVTELVSLRQQEAISLDLLVERLAHTADEPAEVKRIWADIKKRLDLEQRVEMAGLEAQMEMQRQQGDLQMAQQERQMEMDGRKMEMDGQRMEMKLTSEERRLQLEKERAKLKGSKPK